jgi:L-fuconolactonase
MDIIDSHIHFWDLSQNMHSWVKDKNTPKTLQKNFLPETFLAQAPSDLKGLVHIEAQDSDMSAEIEQYWLKKIMATFPKLLFRSIGFVDITLPADKFEQKILSLNEYQAFIGVRHILSYHPSHAYSPESKDLSTHHNIPNNLKLLAKYKLVFECQCYPAQLLNLLPAIVDSNVTCVLEHLLMPIWKNEKEYGFWKDVLMAANKVDNIYMKFSGLSMFDETLDMEQAVKPCLDFFMPNHCLYGSNHPICFTSDPSKWYKVLDELSLSKQDKRHIFYGTAKKVYQM